MTNRKRLINGHAYLFVEDEFWCAEESECDEPRCSEQCDECAMEQARWLENSP